MRSTRAKWSTSPDLMDTCPATAFPTLAISEAMPPGVEMERVVMMAAEPMSARILGKQWAATALMAETPKAATAAMVERASQTPVMAATAPPQAVEEAVERRRQRPVAQVVQAVRAEPVVRAVRALPRPAEPRLRPVRPVEPVVRAGQAETQPVETRGPSMPRTRSLPSTEPQESALPFRTREWPACSRLA